MADSHHPTRSFTLLYAAIALFELTTELFKDTNPSFLELHHFIKPLAMPLLAYYVIRHFRYSQSGLPMLLMGAIFFSWLGDIFLMFQASHFFLLGLGSFLIAQLSYAWLFAREGKAWLKQNIIWLAPFVAYGIGLLWLLWGDLGEMRIPVIIYATAILLMNLAALNRKGNTSSSSFNWVMLGAILFLISDSLIAINKFFQAFEGARIAIMATYLSAQFLLVMGWIKGKSR